MVTARAASEKTDASPRADLFPVEDNGPYGPMGDYRSANAASLIWQPLAALARSRCRLNTPPRSQ
jgi:hypothetical protein